MSHINPVIEKLECGNYRKWTGINGKVLTEEIIINPFRNLLLKNIKNRNINFIF